MLMKTKPSTKLLVLDAAATTLGAHRSGPFNATVRAGERIAILGPSGAGKSTLLKLMSGERAASNGQVMFQARALSAWRLQDLAHHRAVLPQSSEVAFGLQVDLVVGLGRVARLHDPLLDNIVEQAASLARAAHLLGRRFDTLSGGERARVQMARVFAQLWDVNDGLILVDEPLAALDPGLQFDLLDSLDAYAAQRGHAVVAILHDINHAMLGFDRLWLVADGKLVNDLVCSAAAVPALEDLYGITLACMANAEGDLVITPTRRLARQLAQQALVVA
ncbi:MAG: ATP-binding cassette domain-containing protein [Pseudomonadota bacterium]